MFLWEWSVDGWLFRGGRPPTPPPPREYCSGAAKNRDAINQQSLRFVQERRFHYILQPAPPDHVTMEGRVATREEVTLVAV